MKMGTSRPKAHQRARGMATSRICVKNVGKNTSDKQLRELFSKKGEVTDARVLHTKDGKTRRIAFVGFRNASQAEEAVAYYNNTFIGLSRITVELAKRVNDKDLLAKKVKHSKKSTSSDVVPVESDTKVKEGREEPKRKLSKKEEEFLQIMKPRKDTLLWTDGNAQDEVVVEKEEKEEKEIDHDSDSDDDSINDFTTKPTVSDSDMDEEVPTVPIAVTEMSDMDYLRSKMKMNREGESDAASGDKDAEDEDEDEDEENDVDEGKGKEEGVGDDDGDDDDDDDTGRLFLKNIPFACTEDELSTTFQEYGPIAEVHIPLDSETRKGKGFGFVQFMLPENAEMALHELSGSSFQGRVLYVIKAKKPLQAKEKNEDSHDSHAKGKPLSSFQQKKEEERKKNANRKEGWNASFVRSDAVIDSLAEKYGVSHSTILDTNEGGGEMAVRMAIGETQIIQENRAYFMSNGVDINALESKDSDTRRAKRSTTTILIKNLPNDLNTDELESMFARFGIVSSFLGQY